MTHRTPRPPRRTALALGPAALAAAWLSGCGSLRSSADRPDAISVHTQLSGAVAGAEEFEQSTRAYERRTGHPIALLRNGADLPIVFETSSLAGGEADVAIVNMQGRTLTWTRLGATIPVQDLVDEWGLRELIIPEALEEWTTAEGDLRAFPFTRTIWPVSYNTVLLDRAGVSEIPTTSDALVDAADALRSAGIGPVAIGGSDWTGQKMFLQILQGFITQDEARTVFATGRLSESPGALAGVEHFVELREAGVFLDNAQGFTSDSQLTQFSGGKAAITPAMNSALALVPRERAEEVTVGGWPVPSRDAVIELPSIIRSFNGHGIWISERGRDRLDLIRPFVQNLYSDAVIDPFVLGSGRDTSRITDTVPTDFPLVAQSARLTDADVTAVMLPDLLIPESAFEPMIQATASAFGSASVEQIVEGFENSYATA